MVQEAGDEPGEAGEDGGAGAPELARREVFKVSRVAGLRVGDENGSVQVVGETVLQLGAVVR